MFETVPLGSLANFRNGINYNKDNFGCGIKVINVKNFQDYLVPKFEDLDEINPEGIIREESLLQNGDIIFVRSNGNRELIGRSLFIREISEKITHSAFTIKVRFKSDLVLPQFYAYLFRTSLIRQALSAFGSGTNISNLNQEILSNLQVSLPPLSIQKRVVEILSTYDDLIENNTRRIQILEEMAQSLYREWFVKFRFPGHEKVKMVESELGMVPEGWKIEKVNDILKRLKAGTVYTANDVYESGLVPVIDQSRDIFLGFHNNNPDHLATPEKPIVIFGDHTCKMKMMVEPFSVGPNVVPFISQNEVPLIYLYFLVCNLVETKEYKRHWTELKNIKVVFATKDYTTKFANSMTSLFEHIDLLMRKNANLRSARDLLLPKLISGEVDVSSLDIPTGELT